MSTNEKRTYIPLSNDLNLALEVCGESFCVFVTETEGAILQDIAVISKDNSTQNAINCLIYGSENSVKPTFQHHISISKSEKAAIEKIDSF